MFLWHLIFFINFEIEAVKVRPDFVEIFGNEWDKKEKPIKIEQTDENENVEIDQMGGEIETDPNDQQKRKMIQKFETIKERLREKRKYKNKDRVKIEEKIGKLLGANRNKIYKWKKEMNLNKKKSIKMKKSFYDEKKSELIERIDEFKSLYGQGKQKEFVKELGISIETFRQWKKELMLKYKKKSKKYSKEDKLRITKKYFQIKGKHPKISDKIIANELEVRYGTLRSWKAKFLQLQRVSEMSAYQNLPENDQN